MLTLDCWRRSERENRAQIRDRRALRPDIELHPRRSSCILFYKTFVFDVGRFFATRGRARAQIAPPTFGRLARRLRTLRRKGERAAQRGAKGACR